MVDYNFVVTENGALGTLPSGDTFRIDADMVPEFSRWTWRINKDGYLSRSTQGQAPIMLHRWLLAVKEPYHIVDHINHDKTDCRRCNLRIVTAQQNSQNHSRFVTNKTGYTGVFYDSTKKAFVAKVGYKGKRIYLGSSNNNLKKLAQMYNIAASFLFGDYAGALNDVEPPPSLLRRTIINKCSRYVAA